MHRAIKLMLPLGALALLATACSSSVSLGDPKPGAPPDPEPGTEPVIDVPAPKAALEYPAGPYGKKAGDTVANLSWDGYVNGKEGMDAGTFGKISLLDYYDPDGSKGITALKLEAAAVW